MDRFFSFKNLIDPATRLGRMCPFTTWPTLGITSRTIKDESRYIYFYLYRHLFLEYWKSAVIHHYAQIVNRSVACMIAGTRYRHQEKLAAYIYTTLVYWLLAACCCCCYWSLCTHRRRRRTGRLNEISIGRKYTGTGYEQRPDILDTRAIFFSGGLSADQKHGHNSITCNRVYNSSES